MACNPKSLLLGHQCEFLSSEGAQPSDSEFVSFKSIMANWNYLQEKVARDSVTLESTMSSMRHEINVLTRAIETVEQRISDERDSILSCWRSFTADKSDVDRRRLSNIEVLERELTNLRAELLDKLKTFVELGGQADHTNSVLRRIGWPN